MATPMPCRWRVCQLVSIVGFMTFMVVVVSVVSFYEVCVCLLLTKVTDNKFMNNNCTEPIGRLEKFSDFYRKTACKSFYSELNIDR